MAGLADPNIIDVVGRGAGGEYIVFMVEDRPWNADQDQPSQLKQKVNAYAGFILDGSLARHYPETAGKRVLIQLNCVQQPTGDIATILEHTRAQLDKLDIGFRVNVWN